MRNEQTDPAKPKFSPALGDALCDVAWDEIMRLAVAHCLVIDASGGIATLAIPREQRSHGVRERVLRAHMRSETAS
jgi:hypothetical protein